MLPDSEHRRQSMVEQRCYVIVPFKRIGNRLGPRRAVVVQEIAKARQLAQGLAQRMPGVAVLERRIDPETGDDTDTLIAEFGAIPAAFPEGNNWTLQLN
jgi:hypothetical protein